MAENKRTYGKEVAEQYERIQDAFRSIDIAGVTILTGNNGSGKSLIRKQTPFLFKERYGLADVKDTKGMIRSTSMDARTGSNPEWGGLAGVLRDTEWIATSQNTYSAVHGLLESLNDGKTKYAVIDEYEIGCSEETVLAIAMYISDKLASLISEGKIIGAMIITHSRIGVKAIRHDHFVNIGGMTEDEWLNREVVPTDLVKLDDNELFFYIRDRAWETS